MRGLHVDGQTYLAVASDDDVWLWNETRQCPAGRLGGHTGTIRALCVVDTASGPLLATAGADGTVVLRDLTSADPTATDIDHEDAGTILEAHTGWVESVCAVEAGGKTLLAPHTALPSTRSR